MALETTNVSDLDVESTRLVSLSFISAFLSAASRRMCPACLDRDHP